MATGWRRCPHWHVTDRNRMKETIMKRIRRIAVTLTGLALAWLSLAFAAPSAFASYVPAGGGEAGPSSHRIATTTPSPVVHVTRMIVAGGMPGWQIALIAAGAALLAAAVAVLADRAWAARRRTAFSAA
jgi:hypothetical protein